MKYTDAALQWCDDVASGKDDRCEFVRQSCARFIDDLAREGFEYVYDDAAATHACNWIEQLPHTKGRWAAKRELLVLSPWQVFIVGNLFGWVHRETGYRRFREAYIEVARKNGKSLIAAAIGLYLFAADNEFGAEVYSGATTEAQAWEVFRPARLICDRTPDLCEHYGIEVNAKGLMMMGEGNRFEPIIGNPGDGASPSCAIVDEFHEHKTDDLVGTMRTGMMSRDQPLLLIVTTAGVDFGGPCRETRHDIIGILNKSVEDETTFGIIFTIDDGDQWDTPESVKKANPNFGVSINGDALLKNMEKSRRSSVKQTEFKTKHLNMWVGAKSAWMNMIAFQRCKNAALTIEEFAGQRAYVGIDLASKTDFASMAIVIDTPLGLVAFFRHYLPHAAVYDDTKNDRYIGWAENDNLTVTEGNIIDYEYIERDLIDLSRVLDIPEVCIDPHQATQFSTRMSAEGFEMIQVNQTVLSLSEPMKEVEALVLSRRFFYDGDPVLTWMMGNVVAKLDAKDNIYPRKEMLDAKIDGVVALIMAVRRWLDFRTDDDVIEISAGYEVG
jgi:phage terminase large subunit-like protein